MAREYIIVFGVLVVFILIIASYTHSTNQPPTSTGTITSTTQSTPQLTTIKLDYFTLAIATKEFNGNAMTKIGTTYTINDDKKKYVRLYVTRIASGGLTSTVYTYGPNTYTDMWASNNVTRTVTKLYRRTKTWFLLTKIIIDNQTSEKTETTNFTFTLMTITIIAPSYIIVNGTTYSGMFFSESNTWFVVTSSDNKTTIIRVVEPET